MVNWESKKLGDVLVLANSLVFAILLNQLAGFSFFRLDLTEEKRYTIKQATIDMLESLEDDVYVEVYLEGELNAGFRRLRKSVLETLEEFRARSGNRVFFQFTNPDQALSQQARQEFMSVLAGKGIQPINVIDNRDGQRISKLIFPGALVSYGGMETGVMLLKSKFAVNSEEALNQSAEGVEFELAQAIQKLSKDERKLVGVVKGHGELDSIQMKSLTSALLESYDVVDIDLSNLQRLQSCEVVIIAKPTRPFEAKDIFSLDQYVIQGGRLLLMIDPLSAAMDSASHPNYFAMPYTLGLEDQLFRYGVRINQDLVQDLVSLRYPIITGTVDGKPQMTPLEWPFFPLINHYAAHPMTRNLDAVLLKFVSSVDTVKAEKVRKTPLMFTSEYARRISAPVRIDVNSLRQEMKPENFSSGPFAISYLLEGRFTSVFKNRFPPAGVDTAGFRSEGLEAKIIVVADGDIARNEMSQRGGVQPLGFDTFSGRTFANQELIMNMVAYLTEESGLINARNKEVRIRPLDKEVIRKDRLLIQAVNVGLPVFVIVLLGLLKTYLRRRKYENLSPGNP